MIYNGNYYAMNSLPITAKVKLFRYFNQIGSPVLGHINTYYDIQHIEHAAREKIRRVILTYGTDIARWPEI